MTDPFQTLLARQPASPLFADLSTAERVRLGELSTARHCDVGECLVAEGAADPYLYIIRRGRVRVVKSTPDGEGRHTLNVLGPGETLGELKLAAPGLASATVIALEPLDVVCIDLDRLRAEPDDKGLREALLANVACILAERLRGISTKTVEAMEAEIQQGRLRESAGQFIVYLFAIMSGFAFVIAGLDEVRAWHPPQMLLTACLLLGSALPVAVLLRRSPYAAATYGLTLRHAPRVVRDAVVCTLPFLVAITAAKAAWILAAPAHRAAPLFDLTATFEGPFALGPWVAGVVGYSVLSALQEFFARAGLQGSLHLFLPRGAGRSNWSAIVIANLIFTSAHAYLGVRFMLGAFLPGLFWGWLFDRQRSLLGVSVSHALVGVWALFVVGLQVLVGGR